MLKIKNSIDLNDLASCGFKKYEYTHLLVYRKKEHDFATIDIRNRRYEILDLCSLTYNLTFDLIEAKILEKVEGER